MNAVVLGQLGWGPDEANPSFGAEAAQISEFKRRESISTTEATRVEGYSDGLLFWVTEGDR
jgi:hypothetical protein